jgi:hypothetical protein
MPLADQSLSDRGSHAATTSSDGRIFVAENKDFHGK